MTNRRLCVLGTLTLDAPGGAAMLRTRKAAALILYLALQPERRARREPIANMLWPRVESDAARTSLRQLLAGLRKAGNGNAALIEGEGDWLSLAPDLDIDAVAFQAAAARGDTAGASDAVTLYRGALAADGLSVDSGEFDDWLEHERTRLCRIAVAAMETVAGAAIAGHHDRSDGLAAAERAVALDPYNEQAHRALMELQAATGRPDVALRHYAALADTLRRELQVAPDPETQALHDRLRTARRPVRSAAAVPAAVLPATNDRISPPPAQAAPGTTVQPRGRIGSFAPAALVGVMLALAIAAAIGVHRWLNPPVTAPKVARLFPVAVDPSIEQRPAISPDGARVVYTGRLEDRQNVDLYLVTIGDQTPVRLTRDPEIDDNAAWTPDGSTIAFTRSPRDGRSPCAILIMAATGGQERLAGHCRTALTSRLSWAPDGRTLYYSDVATRGDVSRIYRLDTATGATAVVTNPPANIQGDGDPQVSRDGKTLAFLRTKAWQSVEVHMQDMDGGTDRALSHDGKTVWGLAWGPKDDGLFFSSDRDGDTGLWWIARDGSGLTRLALGDVEYRSMSSTHNRLVYEALKDHASFQDVPRDATPAVVPQPIANLRTNLFDRFYVESASGRAAFVSVRSGPENLWVADKGKPPHQITFTQNVFYQQPAWSPDGKWIAYVGVASDQSDLFLINGDGGAPRAVTKDAALQQSPAWSADGKYLYFTSRKSGAWRIWRIDPFGRTPAIAVSGDGPRTVRPSDDGKYLYYAIDGLAGVRRRALAPDGASLTGPEETVITALHPNDWRNWWLADGAIFYARRGGGDPDGFIVRHDLATGTERDVADATQLLWSASFWVRPDGSVVLTHRDLQIDVNGVDF